MKKFKDEFRFFCWVNSLFLSHIQRGIQTAHAVHDLMLKYPGAKTDTYKWASENKTIIIYDGTNAARLKEIYAGFEKLKTQLNYIKFHEDMESLNGCITAVGVVLPASIYLNRSITMDEVIEKKSDIIYVKNLLHNSKLTS